jgi:hypothetical protein
MSTTKATKAQMLMGVNVQFCGHNGYFIADVRRVAGAVAIQAAGPVSPDNLVRDNNFGRATHIVVDFPVPGLWKPALGVFVVPEDQFRELAKDGGR